MHSLSAPRAIQTVLQRVPRRSFAPMQPSTCSLRTNAAPEGLSDGCRVGTVVRALAQPFCMLRTCAMPSHDRITKPVATMHAAWVHRVNVAMYSRSLPCAAMHAPQGAPVAPGAKLPLLGDESIMKPKAHGTTDKPVQVCAF